MNSPSTNLVDYATPQPRRRAPFTDLGMTLYLGIFAGLILLEIQFLEVFMRPFRDTLADHRTRMHWITESSLGLVYWFYFSWARYEFTIWLLLAIPIVVPILLTPLIHRGWPELAQRRRRVAFMVITILGLGYLAITWLAIWVPLVIQIHWLDRAR